MAHTLIASDRVEGTSVCQPDTGSSIGTIQRLMIDKLTGKVAYAVMTFGGFLGFGGRHFPIPWAALRYDPRWEAYVTDITAEQLKEAPSHEADESFDWGDRRSEERLRQAYRNPGYWA
ncbi:MAG: PRC-barrel domain containing protein [Rhizobiales bacterium]|nr:PRC-barrel domain containing protein [Hyphomicrobiales bacterium]